ncbi:MAG: rRNA maturation RNase YbeY [Bacteroidales bacterium]|nr:rRNA maturation RNase YbeY [Bacteroidales bacterium]
MAISFHSQHTHFDLKQKIRHKHWIIDCIGSYSKVPGAIDFVFTSNAHLLRLNREYLNHNYFTDVITFDYTDGNIISGDVFISIDQVKENASFYKVLPEIELRRVMIHGMLHLMGFNDNSEAEKKGMREMENEALNVWSKGE